MKTASTLLLAAALVGGASCKRVLQDIPEVGLGPTRPATSSSSQAESSTTATAAEEEELIDALEADDQVTVVSSIQLGELLCDSLIQAEDAATLSFVLLENERVVADQTSYIVIDGDAFTDGIGRNVWTGVVVDPAQAEDEAVARMISMTWGDECDTETFLLKVTKRNTDDTTSIVKTVPCFDSTTHTCLVEVMVEFEETDDPLVPEGDVFASGSTSTSTSVTSTGEATATATTSASPTRRLQQANDTVIDVMVLYSVSALTAQGGITPQQMETIILEGLVGTNEAMINSDVSVYMNPVHIGLLPYEVTTPDSLTSLVDFQSNENVGVLRDLVGADLVQLVSNFDNSCGRGYLFSDNEAFGYSAVQASCIDNYAHTQAFGINFGGDLNREDTSRNNEFEHAFRYCDGEDPYATLLSFSCGTPRVNYFSNPDVILLNKPTGTPTEDNARAIKENKARWGKLADRARVTTCPVVPIKPNDPPDPSVQAAVSNYRDQVVPPTPAPTTAAPTTTSPTFAPTVAPTPSSTTPSPSTPSPTHGPTPAPTTTAPPPTPYTLVGCYGDNPRDRVLSGDSVKRDSEMTTEVCAALCQGSPYFGTQFSDECYCGVESDDPARLGEATCNSPCAGDASQTCGGRNAINVYQYNTVVLEPEYLGCWGDSKNNRIMDIVESSSSMTNDLCVGICSSYAFFGLQFGRECWCGDDTTDHTINGESTACDRACTGDADAICGGFNAMSVYMHQF